MCLLVCYLSSLPLALLMLFSDAASASPHAVQGLQGHIMQQEDVCRILSAAAPDSRLAGYAQCFVHMVADSVEDFAWYPKFLKRQFHQPLLAYHLGREAAPILSRGLPGLPAAKQYLRVLEVVSRIWHQCPPEWATQFVKGLLLAGPGAPLTVAGEGDGRETWTCNSKEAGKCAGIHEMLLCQFLECDDLARWIRDGNDYDRAFLMGRELSRAQDTEYMDCLRELLRSALRLEDGLVPDWGNVTHFLAGILDGNGHRVVGS